MSVGRFQLQILLKLFEASDGIALHSLISSIAQPISEQINRLKSMESEGLIIRKGSQLVISKVGKEQVLFERKVLNKAKSTTSVYRNRMKSTQMQVNEFYIPRIVSIQ